MSLRCGIDEFVKSVDKTLKAWERRREADAQYFEDAKTMGLDEAKNLYRERLSAIEPNEKYGKLPL